MTWQNDWFAGGFGTWVDEPAADTPYTGSGGLLLAGEAVTSQTQTWTAAGGLLLGGTAETSQAGQPVEPTVPQVIDVGGGGGGGVRRLTARLRREAAARELHVRTQRTAKQCRQVAALMAILDADDYW